MRRTRLRSNGAPALRAAPIAGAIALLLLSLAPPSARAEPLARDRVPEPLRPWVDWVLRGHEAERCPPLVGSDERRCVWPARLELRLEDEGGRFEQEFFVDAESSVILPGDREHWPEAVTLDGRAAGVVAGSGERPTLRLSPGRHRIAGRFVWAELPQVLRVPPETGLVALRVNGRVVPLPSRDAQGRLWLRRQAAKPEAAENRLEVDVHRRVVDEIPLGLTTRIELKVAGESREVLLARALPGGFVPLELRSPIPARLEPDGRVRVQVRPGRWTLVVAARHEGPVAEITLPLLGDEVDGPWDASEVWVFEARPSLRLVELEGAPPVDPTQTELPGEWRVLPAYRMEPGDSLRLVEKRRGSAEPGRDELHLVRSWHLDFDGRGATVVDRIEGTMRSQARLEMGPETVLGRAAVNGEDQPITRLGAEEAGAQEARAGIEVPLGALRVEADSRVEEGAGRLPAVGWEHDFASLQATLQLPPGWRLLHVSGADRARATWIGRWTLLDLFVVMVAAMAFLRLFGMAVGALALGTLALTYTEPGAPQLAWIAVLAAEALRRVVPPGRLAALVSVARVVSLAVLILLTIPFALRQLGVGLYPALERPWAVVTDRGAFEEVDASDEFALEEADRLEQIRGFGVADSAPAEAPSTEVRRRAKAPSGGIVSKEAYAYFSYAPDPNALVPTGPGRPDWQWEAIRLQWSGPVERSQQLGLWLVPPWANAILALLRTGLLLLLVGVALVAARDLISRWRPAGGGGSGGAGASGSASVASGTASAAGLVMALVAGLALGAPARASAEFPTPELLDELRTRLLERPDCHPRCAAIERLALAVKPTRLDARLEVAAAAETAVPLPGTGGNGSGFVPEIVLVDGKPAPALLRSADGRLWLRLSKGTFTVQLRGPLPPRETVELPLPWRPHRVEATAQGWVVQGLRDDGRVEGALQLVRERGGTYAPGTSLEPTAIPPFVRIVRDVQLGLSWQVQTTVERVAPTEGAIVIEVPLLPGESVTTAGVRVKDGRALVSLQPGATRSGWASILPVTGSVVLTASEAVPWTEVWRVDASPLWHVEPRGIPWVETSAAQGRRLREWRPWPGEEVTVEVARPAGVAAGTLTVESSHLLLQPGLRATDATLALRLRSSQGGSYAVTLPEDAELTSVVVNGRDRPIRQEGRKVPVTLVPGIQEIALAWREPRGVARVMRAPEVDLGLPSVNHHVEIAMPPSRWTLWVSGPRLGPAILFWPILVLLAVLAVLLGRIRVTPLRAHHWFLLGVGLTQVPVIAAAWVAAWLLALGWRRERGTELASEGFSAPLFDLLQLVLVALTLVALAALVWSIQHGLLGLPEMQIAGNGSSAQLLRWYQDRTGNLLPRPAVVSVSLWFYRLAMLAWALWVAQALIGWLRWGWSSFATGELWRPISLRRARPPRS